MNLPELIERLREAIDNMGDYARMANIKATGSLAVLNEGVEALEQLAAALMVKDAAISKAAVFTEYSADKDYLEQALALQPHAELVAKMRADAVHEFSEQFDKAWRNNTAKRFLDGDYPRWDTERGEVK